MRDQVVVGDVKRIGGGDLNADGLHLPHGLDRVDEAHRSPSAEPVVEPLLPRQPERLDPLRKADIDDECVMPVDHRSPARQSGTPASGTPAPEVDNAPERPDQIDEVIEKPVRAGRVLDPAGSPVLRDRSTIAVKESLEERDADSCRVVQIRLGDELRVRPRPRQPQFPERRRERMGDDHAATMAIHMTNHIIGTALVSQLDPVKGQLERICELRLRGCERWCSRCGEEPVTEKQSKGIGIERNLARKELGGGREQRKLETVLMGRTQASDHLLRLDDTAGLAAAAICRRRNLPQVLGATQRRGTVLREHPEDRLGALRIHAEDRCRTPIGADHQVADAETPDRAETGGGQHTAAERLRAAPHERQRRDLDHAALEVRGDALGLEHVVERVEQRPQVGVDLGHQVAGEEAEPLAGLDRGSREDDPVDLTAVQRRGRQRNREERLAGARRADPERDRVGADRVDVALLVDGLGRHLARAVAPDDVLQDRGGGLVRRRAPARPPRSSRARARGPGRSARRAP